MSDHRDADEDDYNSSSDEDYDPTKDTEANPQDEIDDAEEGEEELEEDVQRLKEESKSQTSCTASESKVDVDAIFAELTGMAPPTTSTTTSEKTDVEEKVYPKQTITSSSPATSEAPKVYPRTLSEKAEQASPSTGKKRVGLLDAAKALSKRSKMSVLERSDQDWKAFTAQNNLKEDLESHNRGKGGYLNKMEFLDRADNRQFEKERAFRASARKDTNH